MLPKTYVPNEEEYEEIDFYASSRVPRRRQTEPLHLSCSCLVSSVVYLVVVVSGCFEPSLEPRDYFRAENKLQSIS